MRRYTDSAAQRHVMVAFWAGLNTSDARLRADHVAGQPDDGTDKHDCQHGNNGYSFPVHSISPYPFFGPLNALAINSGFMPAIEQTNSKSLPLGQS